MYFEIGAFVAIINVISVFIMMWLEVGPAKQLHTRLVIEKGLGMGKFWLIVSSASLVSIPIIMVIWPVTLLMRLCQAVSHIINQVKKNGDAKQ